MKIASKKVIHEALLEIQREKGRVTAELVVEAAKDESHPLHDQFQWDISKAAYQQWLDTARRLISRVEITRTVNSKVVTSVAYVRDPRMSPKEQGYVAVEDARSDEQLCHEILTYEFSRAAASLRRARDLAAMFEMADEVGETLDRVNAMQDKIKEQRLNA